MKTKKIRSIFNVMKKNHLFYTIFMYIHCTVHNSYIGRRDISSIFLRLHQRAQKRENWVRYLSFQSSGYYAYNAWKIEIIWPEQYKKKTSFLPFTRPLEKIYKTHIFEKASFTRPVFNFCMFFLSFCLFFSLG